MDENYKQNQIFVYDNETYISVTNRNLRYRTGRIQATSSICSRGYALTEETEASPDLSFCTREQADKMVRELLIALEMGSFEEYLSLDACHALSYQHQQSAYSLMSSDLGNIRSAADTIPPKNTWTQEDDAYYLSYSWQIAGLSMTTEPYESLDGRGTFSGSTVSAIVTQHGVELIEAEEVIQVEYVEESKPIISMDEALELLKVKYDNIILTENNTLRKMQLCYLPVAAPDGTPRQHIIPVWRFWVLEPSSSITSSLPHEWTTFHAITGQEI